MATNPYVKTVWVNDEAPPINDTNLNHIEQGIYDATAGLIQAEADLALHTTDINTLSDDLDTAEGNITTLQGQVGSHTIARDVLANEYTNAQIDTKIAEVTPVWGSITGTLSNQTDLQTALDSAGKVKAVDGFNPDTTTGNVTTERVLTQAQYDALSEAEKNNGMTYYISDGEGGGGGSTTATQVSYSNTTSGLTATNVQGAIDEVVSDMSTITATQVSYSNTTSGLTSTSVQGAIDELTAGLGSFTELAHMTAASTTYTLAEDVSKFKCVVAVTYYNNFLLNSLTIPSTLWIAGNQFIVNFNDSTIRKAQCTMVDSTHVQSGQNWSNITGLRLYGVH